MVKRMDKGKMSDRVSDCVEKDRGRCDAAWVPWRGIDGWMHDVGQKCKWATHECVKDMNDFVYCEDCIGKVTIPPCPSCTKL
jgi:hypothetical protein